MRRVVAAVVSTACAVALLLVLTLVLSPRTAVAGRSGVAGADVVPVAVDRPIAASELQSVQLTADLLLGSSLRANPRTSEEAIAWARRQAARPTRSWFGRCLKFVAAAYGWQQSGVRHAIDHFEVLPKAMRFRDDRDAPPGALMYWDTGRRSGHVALALGGGLIATNDILSGGRIDIVDASYLEEVWGARYLGWTAPYFPYGERH